MAYECVEREKGVEAGSAREKKREEIVEADVGRACPSEVLAC